MNESKLTSIKNLGIDLNCLSSLVIKKCMLNNLKGLSSITKLKYINLNYNYITSCEGLF